MLVTQLPAVNSAAQTNSVVTINTDKVMVLNGRKVFPILLSPGPPNNTVTPTGKDALQEFRDAGALMFRISQTTDWDGSLIATQQVALDWAAQHGMYCMVNLRELSAFNAGDTATESELRSVVNQFKNHPALGVWKNKDEAWWGGTTAAQLQRGYDVIKQVDTNHPIEQTHAPRGTVADLQPYNSAADILGLDIYPIGYPPGANSLLTNKEISMIGDYADFLNQVGNGQKHFWMIEQIAWSGVTGAGKTLRFPTFEQSRFMAYQAVIHGARGLMFFGGTISTSLNTQDAPLGWNWTFWDTVLKRVVQQLGDNSLLYDALVVTNSTLPIQVSGATNIEFCVREVPPYLYILACAREGTTTNVTFSGLPLAANTGTLLYEEPRSVTAANGQFTDWFAPFEVHAYRFGVTNFSPAITSQPQSRTNIEGSTAVFGVTATGTPPLSYQWRKNNSPLSNGGNISGATSSALTLTGISQADVASYTVVVSGYGSVTSAPPATLTITQTNPPSQLFLYEPFDYVNIGGSVSSNTPANWSYGGAGANDLSVVAGNLSYAGLVTSIGNSVTNGGDGLGVRRLFGTTLNSSVIYMSALFRINALGFGGWNGAATQVGSIQDSGNTARYQIQVKSNSPSGYVIGLQKSGTGSTVIFDATEYHVGDTVFLVGKYDFSSASNAAYLWINPNSSTFGAASPPASGFLSRSDGTNGTAMDRFNMRQNTAISIPASIQWDELRFGFTWADVTPSASSFSSSGIVKMTDLAQLGNGAFQFAYSNSDNRTYNVFASTNLVNWGAIGGAAQISPGLFQFTDLTATNIPQRFYQLRAQ